MSLFLSLTFSFFFFASMFRSLGSWWRCCCCCYRFLFWDKSYGWTDQYRVLEFNFDIFDCYTSVAKIRFNKPKRQNPGRNIPSSEIPKSTVSNWKFFKANSPMPMPFHIPKPHTWKFRPSFHILFVSFSEP